MVVQHNLQAMNSNRMLGLTSKSLASSTEKLSSGYQINRAADNAAGLAISEKMRKQIRGLDRAALNAEDGISCAQTAEGAMNEVQDMLQRMNELCVQAANGTNSLSDRQYIQDELDQLISEIDRVAETTKFNDTYLLSGDEHAETTNVFTTDYAVTYTRNNVSNAAGPKVPDYKMNYLGTNNVYMVSASILLTSQNMPLSADKIQKGDDLTPYMSKNNWVDNKYGIDQDIDRYVSFINVELDSEVITGKNGNVYSKVPINEFDNNAVNPTYVYDVNSMKKDLSTDGINDKVRANKDLYFYDVARSNIVRIPAGTEVSDYLNDDNTAKDEYRLVDILEGKGVTAQYRGGDREVWEIDRTPYQQPAVTFIKKELSYQDDVTDIYNQTQNHDWAYEKNGHTMFSNLGSLTYTDPITKVETTLYSISPEAKVVYNDKLYTVAERSGMTSMSTDITLVPYPLESAEGTYPTVTLSQLLNIDQVEPVGSDDISNYGTSERVREQVLGKNPDTDNYFDENGNYLGGLYTTPQARDIDEVFGSKEAAGYQNIQSVTGAGGVILDPFITQSSEKVSGNIDLSLHVGADSERTNKINIQIQALTATGLGIKKISSNNIGIVDESGDNATDAIDVIADALSKISRQRASLGAVQNRLEHTIKNLDNVVENTTQAESNIRDTDMAEEMVAYSNRNILQQAGQSMLAQANQSNQGILSLLQ